MNDIYVADICWRFSRAICLSSGSLIVSCRGFLSISVPIICSCGLKQRLVYGQQGSQNPVSLEAPAINKLLGGARLDVAAEVPAWGLATSGQRCLMTLL
jgi:hypothetical protein